MADRPTPAVMTQRLTLPDVVQPPPRPLEPADPAMQVTYWNHPCPTTGCGTWVPNHLPVCAAHRKDTPR